MARNLLLGLPSNWSDYSPQAKINYFNLIGATPQELFAADPTLTQEGLDWMTSEGYAGGSTGGGTTGGGTAGGGTTGGGTTPSIVFPSNITSLTPIQKQDFYRSLLNQGYTDAQIRAAADSQIGFQSNESWNLLTGQTGVSLPAIAFPSNITSLTPIEKQTFYRNLLNQGYTDAQIRDAANAQLGVQSDESWNLLTGQTIIGDTQTLTPSPLSPAGETQIDPAIAPYLTEALGVARNLFLQGPGPQMYPGQMYVPPSQQTLQGLSQAERIALSPEAQSLSTQGLQAYQGALGGLQSMARGDYLQSPEYQRYLESVTRPVTEQVTEQILPSIASQYSAAGRYGSGAMQQATGRATEFGARALGDVTAQVAQQQQGRMLEAQTALPSFLGSMPQVIGGALAPSQALASIGAQREAIAGQPLQESMRRFEYGQQLPYNQLAGYISSIYGSPLANRTASPQLQGNTDFQNIGAFLNLANAVPGAVQGAQTGYNFLRNLF